MLEWDAIFQAIPAGEDGLMVVVLLMLSFMHLNPFLAHAASAINAINGGLDLDCRCSMSGHLTFKNLESWVLGQMFLHEISLLTSKLLQRILFILG